MAKKKSLNLPRAPLPKQVEQAFKVRKGILFRKRKHKGKEIDHE